LSYAVIMEYRKRIEEEKLMKSLLSMLVAKLSYFQNSFQETGRLLVQEVRTMREDVHSIAFPHIPHEQKVEAGHF